MKRILVFAVMALLVFGLGSCHKHKYCQCYAYVDDEDVPLGDDEIDLENLTAEQIEALDASYNLYIIEEGTCNDKAKEIVGWGPQVTCKQVTPKTDYSWFENLFHKNKTN